MSHRYEVISGKARMRWTYFYHNRYRLQLWFCWYSTLSNISACVCDFDISKHYCRAGNGTT